VTSFEATGALTSAAALAGFKTDERFLIARLTS
jgi:hypothetical protein